MSFKLLTDVEHIRHRFSMYGGSQTLQKETVFLDGAFTDVQIVGGLLKITNEIIDNAVDEHIRTDKQFATKIDIAIQNNSITVADNGRGIPAKLIDTPTGKKYQLVTALTHARAGSNFDDSKREGIGTNGVGSALVYACSTDFEAESCDGTTLVTMKAKDQQLIDVQTKKSKRTGTTVKFTPDYAFFGLFGMDQTHIDMIKERIKSLALSYPSISFRFNGTLVNTSFQDYFGACEIFKLNDNCSFGITKSDGSFQSHSLVNGLSVKGGSHIDYVANQITNEMVSAIKRTKKIDIQPNKLKSHLRIHANITGFKALKFDSQTKERVTNSAAEVKQVIGEFDPKKIVAKLLKNKELIDEILAYTKLQEELAAKKDLKKLEKKTKIKSDNYIPAVGATKQLFICEGLSAMGGVSKALGRQGKAYYAIKGVPLNALEVSHQKFSANKELSELYAIITSYDDIDIVIASDADADGSRIASLLSLFVWKYLPDYFQGNRLKILKTPVAISKHSGKIKEWVYNLSDIAKMNNKYKIQYLKGLGSWDFKDLQDLISIEGIDKMLPTISIDNDELFGLWFGSKTSDYRKERIMQSDAFDIMKI